MFKVYIDYDKIYDICLEQDEKDTWYKILCNQQTINVNHSVDDDEFYSEDNPLLLFSQMKGVDFNDATEYMDTINQDNSKVLDEPCSAFILDIDTTKATEIQSRFGVLCQSSSEMSATPLTIGDVTVTTTRPGTWLKRLPFGKVVPSNSLVIVDRYLFGSENDETFADSYENIKDIMEAFMPDTFDAEYHVCIIFDATHMQDRDVRTILGLPSNTAITYAEQQKAFAKISTELNKIKKEFVNKHGYNIVLEVLSCDKRDKQSYDKTHDRKVISNYFYATASHKLKAYRSGTPLLKQKIDLLSLYAKGITDISDIPEYAHADDIKDLRNVMREAKNHPTLYEYSVNGNVNIPVINAKNRILN